MYAWAAQPGFTANLQIRHLTVKPMCVHINTHSPQRTTHDQPSLTAQAFADVKACGAGHAVAAQGARGAVGRAGGYASPADCHSAGRAGDHCVCMATAGHPAGLYGFSSRGLLGSNQKLGLGPAPRLRRYIPSSLHTLALGDVTTYPRITTTLSHVCSSCRGVAGSNNAKI